MLQKEPSAVEPGRGSGGQKLWRLAKLRKIRLRGATDPSVKEVTWPRMIVTAGPIAKSPMAIMAMRMTPTSFRRLS